MQISIISIKGILVNKLEQSGQKLKTLSASENESCTKNSLTKIGDKIGTKNLATLLVGVPMADKTGQNLGPLFITGV